MRSLFNVGSYDLTTVTWTDEETMVKQLKFDMPDIVLVRKVEQDFLIVVLIVV